MDIFDALTFVGGLCLFLYGMNVMGEALERRAGSGLRTLLSRITTGRLAGFITGLGVTAVIQSSSATTVMVVGFVNSGLMTLGQAINVIMGANVGTTVTAWLLSLGGIEGASVVLKLLKPASFTPVLALIGIVCYMFFKSSKKKDTGTILLGFATLMFGMETMSGAVSGLAEVPAFRELFVLFQNPILGVLVGAVVTAIIQSSSASVGILQALAVTGQVTYGAAIPIIIGQKIGTCVTAMISSVGANKNARRAAWAHLVFNIFGMVLCLGAYGLAHLFITNGFFDESASRLGIAVAHTVMSVACVAVMLPMSNLLEKVVCRIVPDGKQPEKQIDLDERLLATPPIALARCRALTGDMAHVAVDSLRKGLSVMNTFQPEMAASIREDEDRTDQYEDELGTYLVKLSSHPISEADQNEAAKLLRMIGDFERISDHSVGLLGCAEELREKNLSFTASAKAELEVLFSAVDEILNQTLAAFEQDDLTAAAKVEPLEQVIDDLKEKLRARHIGRLQQGDCSIEAGFVWSDLLTNLGRVSDHCSNIAGCVIDMAQHNLNLHASLRAIKEESADYARLFDTYTETYKLPERV